MERMDTLIATLHLLINLFQLHFQKRKSLFRTPVYVCVSMWSRPVVLPAVYRAKQAGNRAICTNKGRLEATIGPCFYPPAGSVWGGLVPALSAQPFKSAG